MATAPFAQQVEHLTVKELCRMLHISRNIALGLISEGAFPGCYRLNARGDWRIPLDEIHAFIERRRADTRPVKFPNPCVLPPFEEQSQVP